MKVTLDFCRQEYKRQKKLETIVRERVLNRPKIKKWQVMASFVILPFLLFFCIYFPILIMPKIIFKILCSFIFVLMLFETYFRFCLICVVKYYQKTAKEETRKRCKCIPSCSEYAILALKKVFPICIALLKIRKRLYVTCNGEEYKIDFPIKRLGVKFESKL